MISLLYGDARVGNLFFDIFSFITYWLYCKKHENWHTRLTAVVASSF
jgi:hypothetical protein